MENLKELLLGMDTLILVIIFIGAFIAWELKAGEIPLRWFGAIRRERTPIIYWISMLFHLAFLVFLAYIWTTGLRMPVSVFFE